MEENILSLTDGMAETVLRMKSMNSYWTLIFNCISTTSRKQWLPSHSDIFLSFQAIWQDNAGIQLVLVTVLVPAMMPSVLSLCRELLYISVLRSLSLSLSSVLYTTQKSDFQTGGKFITYLSPESIKKPEAIMNSKEHIFKSLLLTPTYTGAHIPHHFKVNTQQIVRHKWRKQCHITWQLFFKSISYDPWKTLSFFYA